jgi:hypothetical protein
VRVRDLAISTEDGGFPADIDVLFLPIGVRKGNVGALGVDLAQGRGMGSWYKSGMYVAESFVTYSFEEGEIVVGKLGQHASL